MQATIVILGKEIQVEWSEAVDKQLNLLATPLKVEMELYFSCLIRKTVRFGWSSQGQYSAEVTPRLSVAFRPVMTKVCKVSEDGDEPPLEDFHISKPQAFVPKKRMLDFKRGQWKGAFRMSGDS